MRRVRKYTRAHVKSSPSLKSLFDAHTHARTVDPSPSSTGQQTCGPFGHPRRRDDKSRDPGRGKKRSDTKNRGGRRKRGKPSMRRKSIKLTGWKKTDYKPVWPRRGDLTLLCPVALLLLFFLIITEPQNSARRIDLVTSSRPFLLHNHIGTRSHARALTRAETITYVWFNLGGSSLRFSFPIILQHSFSMQLTFLARKSLLNNFFSPYCFIFPKYLSLESAWTHRIWTHFCNIQLVIDPIVDLNLDTISICITIPRISITVSSWPTTTSTRVTPLPKLPSPYREVPD